MATQISSWVRTQQRGILNPMIVTVASFKGGVGKTTTAVHLAAYLATKAKTVLIDGDPNHSATAWSKRGQLPFSVVDERLIAKASRQHEHLVIDTQARPSRDDLRSLIDGCDLLVIPTTPDAMSLDALWLTIEELKTLGADRYKILLTIIPPKPSRDGDEARSALVSDDLPVFGSGIRRLAAFQKAALTGVLVSEIEDPRADLGWQDYEAVGKELLS